MATAGEMVKAMAVLFSMAEATTESIDRALSENGMRTKGGRGRSAARMSGIDIVNLMIALIFGAGMKDAPSTVAKVTRMPRQSATVQWSLDAHRANSAMATQVDQYQTHPAADQDLSPLPGGRAMADAETLGEGVAALIDAMAAGELDDVPMLEINLQMNSLGPSANFVYRTPDGVIRTHYRAEGEEAERPMFERNLKLNEEQIRRLAEVIRQA